MKNKKIAILVLWLLALNVFSRTAYSLSLLDIGGKTWHHQTSTGSVKLELKSDKTFSWNGKTGTYTLQSNILTLIFTGSGTEKYSINYETKTGFVLLEVGTLNASDGTGKKFLFTSCQ